MFLFFVIVAHFSTPKIEQNKHIKRSLFHIITHLPRPVSHLPVDTPNSVAHDRMVVSVYRDQFVPYFNNLTSVIARFFSYILSLVKKRNNHLIHESRLHTTHHNYTTTDSVLFLSPTTTTTATTTITTTISLSRTTTTNAWYIAPTANAAATTTTTDHCWLMKNRRRHRFCSGHHKKLKQGHSSVCKKIKNCNGSRTWSNNSTKIWTRKRSVKRRARKLQRRAIYEEE